MVWCNLWQRKACSLLTVLDIAIGVAVVVALGAMAEGTAAGYAGLASGNRECRGKGKKPCTHKSSAGIMPWRYIGRGATWRVGRW